MKTPRYTLPLMILFVCIILVSCKKGWLDAKPNKSLLVPVTEKDFQAFLDNTSTVFNINQPFLGELSADNYYVKDLNWTALNTQTQKNAYIWAENVYEGEKQADWREPFIQIFNANVVLEGVEKYGGLHLSPQSEWANIKGQALFFRAYAFYSLADVFCKPYNSKTAETDPGIPLRLNSDINMPTIRSSVKDSYERIIIDLKEARFLLTLTPLYKTRPSIPAAFGMLARVYLAMEDYDNAFLYADSCLQIRNTLLNYNQSPVNSAASFPIPQFNEEVIFHHILGLPSIFRQNNLIVDSVLFGSYNANDLRKSVFFTTNAGNITFRGSYNGSISLFSGLAVDEIYLIRAECYARKGNANAAMQDLNTLLIKRWKNSVPYSVMSALDANDALNKILVERRKELIFRGLRWADLRRLNRDDRFKTTLKRFINGQWYSLLPSQDRYVLPIPDDEIQLSGIPQNPR